VRRHVHERVKIDVFLSFIGYFLVAFIRELLREKNIEITLEKLTLELSRIRLVSKTNRKNNTKSYEIIGNTDIQKKIISCLNLDESIEYLQKVSTT